MYKPTRNEKRILSDWYSDVLAILGEEIGRETEIEMNRRFARGQRYENISLLDVLLMQEIELKRKQINYLKLFGNQEAMLLKIEDFSLGLNHQLRPLSSEVFFL